MTSGEKKFKVKIYSDFNPIFNNFPSKYDDYYYFYFYYDYYYCYFSQKKKTISG